MSTEYAPEELTAKAAWEALKPEPGTILWLEMWFADNTMDIPSVNSGWHYRALMATLKEWDEERAESGVDEETWLADEWDQYEQALIDTFEFEIAYEAEMKAKAAKLDVIKGQLAESGVSEGHAIPSWFHTGAADEEQNVAYVDLAFGYLPLSKVGF